MPIDKDKDPPQDDNDFFDDSHDSDDEWNDDDEFNLGDDDLNEKSSDKNKKPEHHPVYKQSIEILQLTEALVASLEEKETVKNGLDIAGAHLLMQSAAYIPPKIINAITAKDYVSAMQCAALIREHAEFLRLGTNTLHHFVKVDKNHCLMHREEMEKFRRIFVDWMEELKQYDNDMRDEWNVF